MAIFIGGSYVVHSVAEQKPLGGIAYGAWMVLLGLLISPIVLHLAGTEGGGVIIKLQTNTNPCPAVSYLSSGHYYKSRIKDLPFLVINFLLAMLLLLSRVQSTSSFL